MKHAIRYYMTAAFLLLLPVIGCTQAYKQALLQSHIQAIIDTSHAKIGVGILDLDFKEQLTINSSQRFPMQSVFKFPLALAILDKVDKGTLSLTQSIHIVKESLDTGTWSPMVKDFPGQDIDITLAEVLRYSVSKSDNNACDVLFKLVGGTEVVDKYMHRIGIKDIAIKATEKEMKAAWHVQYNNWCQPAAMLQLLRMFYKSTLLSKSSNAYLMKLMTETITGPNRIKGLLPTGTVVAHKTGTSGTNAEGMNAATNDVGIITLPDGRHYALVVYVSDYKGGTERGEHIIATISRVVWDYFQ